jgi:hypothetical protein
MRLARFVSCCVVLVLVAGEVGAGEGKRHAARQTEVSASGSDSGAPTWTITAYGETEDRATERAREKAWEQVCDYLTRLDPPVHWRPDVNWVDNNLVKSRPPAKQVELEDLGKGYERQLLVKVEAKERREMMEHDRQETMRQRQLLLARILAGVVALLVAVVGYLRLDEATKGYYTLWLRLGALGLVGGVGAVLWLVA